MGIDEKRPASPKGNPTGLMPADESLGAGKCHVCGRRGCTVHWHAVTERNPMTHKTETRTRWYCDCSCYEGVVTGWYDTPEEAVDAWNRGIWSSNANEGESK